MSYSLTIFDRTIMGIGQACSADMFVIWIEVNATVDSLAGYSVSGNADPDGNKL
jgi:hypothetical protein